MCIVYTTCNHNSCSAITPLLVRWLHLLVRKASGLWWVVIFVGQDPANQRPMTHNKSLICRTIILLTLKTMIYVILWGRTLHFETHNRTKKVLRTWFLLNLFQQWWWNSINSNLTRVSISVNRGKCALYQRPISESLTDNTITQTH